MHRGWLAGGHGVVKAYRIAAVLTTHAYTPSIPFCSFLPPSPAHSPLPAASLAAQQQQTSRSSPFANSSSSTRQPPAALASTRPRYVAWAGAVSSAPGVLELPAHLAAALQLPSGTEVVLQVRAVFNLPPISHQAQGGSMLVGL